MLFVLGSLSIVVSKYYYRYKILFLILDIQKFVLKTFCIEQTIKNTRKLFESYNMYSLRWLLIKLTVAFV